MPDVSYVCPECGTEFIEPESAARMVCCPGCEEEFSALPEEAPPAPEEPRRRVGPSMFIGLVLLLIAFAVGTFLFGQWKAPATREGQARAKDPAPKNDARPHLEPLPEPAKKQADPVQLPRKAPPPLDPPQPFLEPPKKLPDPHKPPPDPPKQPPDPPKKLPDPPKPPPDPPKPELTDAEKVGSAVDRGIKYLRAQLKESITGTEPATKYGHTPSETRVGHLALMGLTLLECDAPSRDPQIRIAAAQVRTSLGTDVNVYDLSLAIMFLDRLGDRDDRKFIEMLALRLVAGLTDGGNWNYGCKTLSNTEQAALLAFLHKAQFRIEDDEVVTANREAAAHLPASIRKLAIVRWCSRATTAETVEVDGGFEKRYVGLPIGRGGNNSCTQFGLLGLWVAQRSGAPVASPMAMVAAHFRASQKDDGGWTYSHDDPNAPFSMTCAGLLGLAIGRSLDAAPLPGDKKPVPGKDPALNKGMKYLGNSITLAQTLPAVGAATSGSQGKYLGKLFYFWSLARVAVLFGMNELDGQDWYEVVSKEIVESQKVDGSWADLFPGVPDTCFALLVLKRSNVAKDLTKQLEIRLDIKNHLKR